VPGDRFEPNDTSDRATNFGLLALGTVPDFPNLTVATHPNGQPDYDWYRWTMGANGTFAVATNDDSGLMELHLFTLAGNSLVELAQSTAPGATFRTVGAKVAAGQTIFVEVKGHPIAAGVFGQTDYDMQVSLT
jgi:hypothetical protein